MLQYETMTEPLLGSDIEGAQSSTYDDIFVSDVNISYPRRLSNGTLFFVLSLAEWERERVELARAEHLRAQRFPSTESMEDNQIEDGVLRVLVSKILTCFKFN